MKFGLKLVTGSMIKTSQKYFAIKNGILYCYSHERARIAEKEIVIKDAKAIGRDQKSPKEFYIIYKQKFYRLGCISEDLCLKWVNSLKKVQSSGEEHLDLNRYEKQKIFSRITGKSMYKDYEVLLENYENIIH